MQSRDAVVEQPEEMGEVVCCGCAVAEDDYGFGEVDVGE